MNKAIYAVMLLCIAIVSGVGTSTIITMLATEKAALDAMVAKEKRENDRRHDALSHGRYRLYMHHGENISRGPDSDYFEVRLCWWDSLNEDGTMKSGMDEPVKSFKH